MDPARSGGANGLSAPAVAGAAPDSIAQAFGSATDAPIMTCPIEGRSRNHLPSPALI